MLVAGIAISLGADPRLGMMLVGLLLGLAGLAQVRAARRGETPRGLRTGMGAFLVLFGLFTIGAMTLLLVLGERLGDGP